MERRQAYWLLVPAVFVLGVTGAGLVGAALVAMLLGGFRQELPKTVLLIGISLMVLSARFEWLVKHFPGRR